MNPYRRDVLLDGMLTREDRFIGPRDEVEWLLARVSESRPAAVSLVGQWGAGKSFLLTFLANPQGARRMFKYAIGDRFSDDPKRLLFVLLDFEDRAFGERAAAHLMELLYEQTLIELANLLEIPDARLIPLDCMPAERQPLVAKLCTLVRERIDHAREETDDVEARARFDTLLGKTLYDKLVALLGRLDTWGLRVTFLIDDFDTIISSLDRADFDHLRTLLSAASLVLVTRRALSKLAPAEVQSSPFFNLVQRLNLRHLYVWPLEEARRMITEPPKWFKDPPEIQFSESDVTFILDLTGLHPDLISKVCEELYMRYRRQPISQRGDVLPPGERPFLRAQLRALFDDSFAAIWHRMDKDERTMLMKIATGQVVADETPTTALTALINRGYIVYEQGCYRLFAGLFRDYILEQNNSTASLKQVPVRASLTELEAKLLELLKAKPDVTIDHDEIIAALYDVRSDGRVQPNYRNRLDALLFRLREKLANEQIQIDNIRGQGYRLVYKDKRGELVQRS